MAVATAAAASPAQADLVSSKAFLSFDLLAIMYVYLDRVLGEIPNWWVNRPINQSFWTPWVPQNCTFGLWEPALMQADPVRSGRRPWHPQGNFQAVRGARELGWRVGMWGWRVDKFSAFPLPQWLNCTESVRQPQCLSCVLSTKDPFLSSPTLFPAILLFPGIISKANPLSQVLASRSAFGLA